MIMDAFAPASPTTTSIISRAPGAFSPGLTTKTATVNFFPARLQGLPDLKVSIQASLAASDKCRGKLSHEGTQQGPLYCDAEL